MSRKDFKKKFQRREIRVFISSTFVDLEDERDYIIRRTFPRLQEYCKIRGIQFTGVDLRWGITEAQSNEGKTIKLCLDEIKRCEPYFVNIIGARYGWVPEEADFEMDSHLRDDYNDLIEHSIRSKISITELEISQAVFEKDEKTNAFFFLGDMDLYKKKNIERGIPEEDQVKQEKLLNLREKIKNSGYPVFENFKGKEHLGEVIFIALKEAIDKEYPLEAERSECELEVEKHLSFALSRKRYYQRDEIVFNKLLKYIMNAQKPIVVYGESGTGKSALVANFAQWLEEEQNVDVIEHYVGASSGSELDIIRHLLMELEAYDTVVDEKKYDISYLKNTLVNRINQQTEKIVIAIDAINQISNQFYDFSWVNECKNPNISLLITTTNQSFVGSKMAKNWNSLQLKGMDKEFILKMIVSILELNGKALDEKYLTQILDNSSHFSKMTKQERNTLNVFFGMYAGHIGNPMFLNLFLNELMVSSNHMTIANQIEHYLNAKNIHELILLIFNRLESDFGEEVVKLILGHIAVSRNGLSEHELRILAYNKGIAYLNMVECLNSLSQHLMLKGDRFDFFHMHISNAVKQKYLATSEDEKAFRMSMIEVFKTIEDTESRIFELPYQLLQLNAFKELSEYLTSGDDFGYLSVQFPFDLFSYISECERAGYSLLDDYFSVNYHKCDEIETIAQYLYEVRMYHSAEKAYRKLYSEALENQSEHQSYLKGLINTLYHSGNYSAALEFAQKEESHYNRARIYKALGDYVQAQQYYQILYDESLAHYGRDTLKTLVAEEDLYTCMVHTDKVKQVIERLLTVLDRKKKLLGESHAEIGKTNEKIAQLYDLNGKKIMAQIYYEETLSIYREVFGNGHLMVADILEKLKQYEEAWLIKVSVLGDSHEETLRILKEVLEPLKKKRQTLDQDIKKRFYKYILDHRVVPKYEEVNELIPLPKAAIKHNRRVKNKNFQILYLLLYYLSMLLILPTESLIYFDIGLSIILFTFGASSGYIKNYFAVFEVTFFAFLPSLLYVIDTISSMAISKILLWLWSGKYTFETWAGIKYFNHLTLTEFSNVLLGSNYLIMEQFRRMLFFSVGFIVFRYIGKYVQLYRKLKTDFLLMD